MQERVLPDNCFLQSFLNRSGVRFVPNTVDTCCNRGIGVSAAVVAVLTAILIVGGIASPAMVPVLLALTILYILIAVGRWVWAVHTRRRLRADPNPVICESHAIVILDAGPYAFKYRYLKQERCAIVYKESGSAKPRFFTGAVNRRLPDNFVPGRITRVFVDRRRERLYSVDEEGAYQARKILSFLALRRNPTA